MKWKHFLGPWKTLPPLVSGGSEDTVSHTDEGWRQGEGNCGGEGVALGGSSRVLSDCQL